MPPPIVVAAQTAKEDGLLTQWEYFNFLTQYK